MPDFLRRFGQKNEHTGEYYFSNVRAGLIVGLVRFKPLLPQKHD
jgi:MFS transporter, SP family, sugar:H+ symporter